MEHVRKVAKQEANKAVGKHVKDMHAKGMKKGGPTSEDRMRMGRNLSRAANQKTG